MDYNELNINQTLKDLVALHLHWCKIISENLKRIDHSTLNRRSLTYTVEGFTNYAGIEPFYVVTRPYPACSPFQKLKNIISKSVITIYSIENKNQNQKNA